MIRKIIAGVALTAEHDSDLTIPEIYQSMESFSSSGSEISADHQIRLRIQQEPIPVFTHRKTLFNTNGSWSVHQEGSFYWIVLHPAAFGNPLWATRVNHGFSDGSVLCSTQMVHPENPRKLTFNPLSYPLDQILLMNFLATIGGMIIHAAGWRINNSGWIFAGKSGAGKSTISNLIVEATSGKFLSDDRIIIRKIGQDFFMCGTPWPGDAGYAVNKSVPLKGLFFLSKGEKNSIRALNPAEAIPKLMPVVSIPWYDREKVESMMAFCGLILENMPVYELTFVRDKTIVDALVKFVNQ